MQKVDLDILAHMVNLKVGVTPLNFVGHLSTHSSLHSFVSSDTLFCCCCQVRDLNGDLTLGYQVQFQFKKDNPFFSNEELTKEFRLLESGDAAVVPTPINWKDSKVLACPAPPLPVCVVFS